MYINPLFYGRFSTEASVLVAYAGIRYCPAQFIRTVLS